MKVHAKSWPAATIRAFAILNLLMGLEGLAALLDSVITRLTCDPWPQDPPYLAQAYYMRSAINLVFVILTIVSGVYLWRLRRRGWTMCKVLFIGQIAYFFIDWFDFLLSWVMGEQGALLSRAFGASGGTGNMGTAIQTITAYPVIALIGLMIAYGRLGHARTSMVDTAPPAGADPGL
jgi:hypothetical protein